LDETAGSVNTRVGQRLAELLTILHVDHGLQFDVQAKADQLTKQFAFGLTVVGTAGTLSPL